MSDEIKKYQTLVGILFFSGLILVFASAVGLIIAMVAGNTDLIVLFIIFIVIGAILLLIRHFAFKKLTKLRAEEKQE